MMSFYDETVETMPRAAIEALQEDIILRLVPYVLERSPIVREVWAAAGVKASDIRSLQDYRDKAPFLDKDALRSYRDRHGDPLGGLQCQSQPHLRGVGFSSGTTGDPTAMPFSDRIASNVQLRRDLWQIGLRPGDYFIFDIPAIKRGQEAARFSDIDFRPICFGHSVGELPRMLAACEQFKPKIFHTLSRPLISGLEEIDRRGEIDLKAAFAGFKGAVFGGEPPSPKVVAQLKDWGLELFDYTSLGDASAAMECREHDGMHAWEDLVLVECLQPDSNEPVPDGMPGELVVTALYDDVAPLVRFRSSDLITLTREPCACGRTHCRIKVLGRISDQVVVNGRSIMPRDLMPVIDRIAEVTGGMFQVVRSRRQLDVLTLRIGVETEDGAVASRVSETVGSAFGVTVAVEMVPASELAKLGPPHKIPRVTRS
jgi:phenylacetate-CoA ligase